MASRIRPPTEDSVWAPVTALEAAHGALKAGSAEAASSIKRIAGRIVVAARDAGMERAATAAAVLQDMNLARSPEVVLTMLGFIREELSEIGQERQTVLIVEDDRLMASVLKDVLASSDWDVLVAETRADAERQINSREVSVVLLDLMLPDADGRDLLVKLRSSARTAWLPVIVLSAKDDPATQSECYALGADGFLVKPVDFEIMKAAISSKLQRTRQMHREAHLDSLTLLPNRAAFWDAFERALARRSDSPLSVAVIDLGDFKAVNDTHGHSTGDEVLRIVARVLANSLRSTDFLARWGGEEFCVFMPNTELRAATLVLEDALQRLRETTIAAEAGGRFSITFSAGVATVGDGVGGGDALALADRRLYAAKKSGRNQVVSTADAEPPKPRVLIADDDPGTRTVVRRVLEKEGFEVLAYPDGASALAGARIGEFMLAVVDATMPEMDGFELVRQLRGLPKFAQTPIVMLTGLGAESDIVRGFDLGVSDYVVKPFNRGEFVARIWRLLKRRRT
jgi:diguanylate cyclase (GGDEF)-like protein